MKVNLLHTYIYIYIYIYAKNTFYSPRVELKVYCITLTTREVFLLLENDLFWKKINLKVEFFFFFFSKLKSKTKNS